MGSTMHFPAPRDTFGVLRRRPRIGLRDAHHPLELGTARGWDIEIGVALAEIVERHQRPSRSRRFSAAALGP